MLYVSHGADETRRLAGEKAKELTAHGQGAPLIIALEGELGAGKTTFTQAFSEALGVQEKIKSPTFVLMKEYNLISVPGYQKLYHLDCYRLNNSADLHPLGIEDILKGHGNIVLIEWAERVKDILPKHHLRIHIDHVAEHIRNINITVPGIT